MSRFVDVTTQTSVKRFPIIEVGGLDTYVLNELNYQYFYQVGTNSPEYYSRDGSYEFKYQAIGTQIDSKDSTKLLDLMSDKHQGRYQINEHAMMNEKIIRFPISPSEFIITFDKNCLKVFDVNILQDSKESFIQEVCRQHFPVISGPDNKLQFNLFATHQLKAMCVDIQKEFKLANKINSGIKDIEDPIGYIQQVLPTWLECNSFNIYSEDGSKSIRLTCPFFSYKSALHSFDGKGKPRSYCVLKFLEWKDDQICPYMYTVELDPIRELIQKLRLSIDGVVYLMYVRLADIDYYRKPMSVTSLVYVLPDGVSDTYQRETNPYYMFRNRENPDSIVFFDPVQGTKLVYEDFSIEGDCFPIALTTCLLTLQPDMFRYINLFRYTEYAVHADNYLAHNSKIKRALFTSEDDDMIDLIANRLQYAYPIASSSYLRNISGQQSFLVKEPRLINGKIHDMENVIYWSPCFLLSTDYFATEIEGRFPAYEVVAEICGNSVYKNGDVLITRGFVNINDNDDRQKEYLYSIFDDLGCNTEKPTFFPVLIHGHITTLAHIVNNDGTRIYLIVEPQNGSLIEVYEYLKKGNGDYFNEIPSTAAYIQFGLTRTCRKNNHIKSLASPLVMYSAIDPVFYKGDFLPIYQQSLTKSYLLLRESSDTSSLSLESLYDQDDFSLIIQRNSVLTDPTKFSSLDWLRIQLSVVPLIGSLLPNPDLLIDLTHKFSADNLYLHFENFLTFLSNSLPAVVNRLFSLSPEEMENPYLSLAGSIFRVTDQRYDSSIHISYLTDLYQRLNALHLALYHGLKILYITPSKFANIHLIPIQQFMNLLETLRDNLFTIEMYNPISARQIYTHFEDKLSDHFYKSDVLDLLYSKPAFRTLLRFHIDNPALLPDDSIPIVELIASRIANKPLLHYKELFKGQLNANTVRVLNFIRYLTTTNQEQLPAFIQSIQFFYQKINEPYNRISPDTLGIWLSVLFDELIKQVPTHIEEPPIEDKPILFSYFIFIVNLFRFETSSSIFDYFA